MEYKLNVLQIECFTSDVVISMIHLQCMILEKLKILVFHICIILVNQVHSDIYLWQGNS